jgi:hypothetical protein
MSCAEVLCSGAGDAATSSDSRTGGTNGPAVLGPTSHPAGPGRPSVAGSSRHRVTGSVGSTKCPWASREFVRPRSLGLCARDLIAIDIAEPEVATNERKPVTHMTIPAQWTVSENPHEKTDEREDEACSGQKCLTHRSLSAMNRHAGPPPCSPATPEWSHSESTRPEYFQDDGRPLFGNRMSAGFGVSVAGRVGPFDSVEKCSRSRCRSDGN